MTQIIQADNMCHVQFLIMLFKIEMTEAKEHSIDTAWMNTGMLVESMEGEILHAKRPPFDMIST